jgi:hypothetical protein
MEWRALGAGKEAQYLEYERLMEQYGLFRKERFEVTVRH